MKTPWSDKIDLSAPLPEYPRPQMRRDNWLNLNGYWDYAINNSPVFPYKYDGRIVVPFSPESALSGVSRSLEPGQYLWYRRVIRLPESFSSKRVLLHFGAVDQEANVWVNRKKQGSHEGGYLPFEFDITDALSCDDIEIIVRIRDGSDTNERARGKQRTKRGGIWYTPQSGIWQTVWMEAVPDCYVKKLRICPDFDRARVDISAEVIGEGWAYAHFNEKFYLLPASIPVTDFEAWCPDNPKLYDFSVSCGDDKVESYFAMRKFSVEKDEKGTARLFLNGKVCFHNGLLDQGYWPDGLYTAPCEEALEFDIRLAKSMGFNMLRKHIKVEPLRWYYLCDKLGMLVWQDMPNGGGKYNVLTISSPLVTNIHFKDNAYALFARRNKAERERFMRELREMIEHLYNCPCISVWVPFNEGWGQFDAQKAYDLIRSLDTSRTIDHASGWHDQGISDVRSDHVYFRPYKFRADKRGRAVLLSEFGGYNFVAGEYDFNKGEFGYRHFESAEKLTDAIEQLYQQQIRPAIDQGLAAAVYTQLSDVEDEVNGFVSYDRRVVKIDPETVKRICCVGD